ncbi:glycosyltransferase family 4 protein [Zavarzinella formosa]|uniref:glycosyltransferase family 4 protein n=1 Tax=Zavarzinella formosa TaxID=360055 RepID=UPI0002F37A9E|nr:glycosyltransferase family 4 protein [Zavarzinella formosa]
MPRELNRCSIHHLLDTGELGGGNLVALATARLMKPLLAETHLWLDHGPAEAVGRADGLTLHHLGQAKLRSAGRFTGRYLEWKLGRQFRKFGPGILYSSSAFLHGLTGRAAKASGLPRLVHVQIEDTIPNWKWAFREPPDAIITCAKFLAAGVREALPVAVRDQIPIHSVSNAVDLDRFSPGDRIAAKQKVNAPADRPLILMLANLAPHKGQRTAIQAMADLRNRGILAECWLAGTERGGQTEFTNELTRQIATLGLGDRVKLLGHRTDAPDLLQAADVFLLPSTNEGLPLSILEAQAVGVPVLAAPTAGVPETITDDVTGYLIPADDAKGYADKIALLLEQPAVRHRLTEAAMSQIRREYTWTVFGERLRTIYEDLAKTLPT